MILAKSGDTIYLPEGKTNLNRSLRIDKLENVIIKGSGILRGEAYSLYPIHSKSRWIYNI